MYMSNEVRLLGGRSTRRASGWLGLTGVHVDSEERNRLVLTHLPLVGYLVSDLCARATHLTREDMASFVEPLGRIDNRLQTRVQNRLRNRIDRYYDPRANATAPFRTAVYRARVDGSRPRR